MNLFAPAQSERQFQDALVQYAHLLHWRCMHISDSRREVVRQDGARHFIGDKENAGWPDLTLVRERLVIAELKSETGKLSKAQLEWIGALQKAGQEVYVWRPSCWDQIRQVLA